MTGRRLARNLVVILVTGWLAGCALMPGAAPLRVGTAANMPPLVFLDNGQVSGLEVDLANLAASRIKRRIEWKDMPFEALVPALQRGDVDVIMAGMSVTPERQREVLFTREYMQGGLMAIMRKADLGRLNSMGAVRQPGRRIGVEAGTVAEAFVSADLPGAAIMGFSSTAEMVHALYQNQVDYLVLDAPVAWYLTSQRSNDWMVGFFRYLTHEPIAWAVSRNAPGLKAQLDDALEDMLRTGELDQRIHHWIPLRMELE